MPKYILPNGKSVYSENPIPDNELDDFLSSFMEPPSQQPQTAQPAVQPPKQSTEQPGLLKRAWDITSEPLTTIPSEIGRQISGAMENSPFRIQPSGQSSIPGGSKLRDYFAGVDARARGFVQGAVEGTSDLISGLSSPQNLATSLLFGGSVQAAKQGLKQVAKALSHGAKGTAVPVVAHGAIEAGHPESSLMERGMGLMEMAGGGSVLATPRVPSSPRTTQTIKTDSGTTNVTGQKDIIDKVYGPVQPTPVQPRGNLSRVADEIIDPNLNQGMGNPELAGSTPYTDVPPIPDDFFARMGPEPTKPSTPARIVRQENFTPDVLKRAKEQGYELAGQNERGDFRFVKIGKGESQPILESEIPRPKTSFEKLGQDLAGAKPRFNIGKNSYTPNFADDLDKALFIIAQKTASKRDADYLKYVMKQTGMDEQSARRAGQQIRATIKDAVKGQEPGSVDIPAIHRANQPPTTSTGPVTNRQMFERSKQLEAEGRPTPKVKQSTLPPEFQPDIPLTNEPALGGTSPKFGENKEPGSSFDFPEGPSKQRYYELVDKERAGTLTADELLEAQRLNKELRGTGGGNLPPNKPPSGNGPPPMGPDDMNVTVPDVPDKKISLARKLYDLPRGLMSVDPPFVTSAAFRQASSHVGTKNWFKSWGTAAKSFGSQKAYDNIMQNIDNNPIFRPRAMPGGKTAPSFAEEIGLRMTDLKDAKSTRMEGFKNQLAESIPVYGRYVKASNRAFSGFLNSLRANQLEQFIKDGKILAKIHNDPTLDLTQNLTLARNFAEFLNDTTGAGSLRFGFGREFVPPSKPSGRPETGRFFYSLEAHAQKLADAFFSPRLIASRLRMLNPNTYIMKPPQLRKQYAYGMLRTIGTWWGMAQLAKMAGSTVVTDPNNPDFGKIKIGDTRLDPGAGFQQFLVLASRIKPEGATIPGVEPTDTGFIPLDLLTGLAGTPGGQFASSISGENYQFGVGFNPTTRWDAIENFITNKLHPTSKFIYDALAANERKPFYLGDKTLQLFLPMMSGDIAELLQEDPTLLPLIIPATGVGLGSQTYTGEPSGPTFTPLLGLDEYDISIGEEP